MNAHYCELFIWIDCLRRASAKQVTAVIPYFGYARQDRKDDGPHADHGEAVCEPAGKSGRDRVVAIDLHAAQVQGFFDVPVDHLLAVPVFTKWVRTLELDQHGVGVTGRGEREAAQVYAKELGGEICIIDKRRKSGPETQARRIIGDVAGKTC